MREDLQGNRGNLFGMNASSASLVKAFVELDPYQARTLLGGGGGGMGCLFWVDWVMGGDIK